MTRSRPRRRFASGWRGIGHFFIAFDPALFVGRRLGDYGGRYCLDATMERAPPVDVDAPDHHYDNDNDNQIRTSSDAR